MYFSLILVGIPSILIIPVKNRWVGERGGLLNRQNLLSVTKVICRQTPKSKWNQLKFCIIQVTFPSVDHYILRQDVHCSSQSHKNWEISHLNRLKFSLWTNEFKIKYVKLFLPLNLGLIHCICICLIVLSVMLYQ